MFQLVKARRGYYDPPKEWAEMRAAMDRAEAEILPVTRRIVDAAGAALDTEALLALLSLPSPNVDLVVEQALLASRAAYEKLVPVLAKTMLWAAQIADRQLGEQLASIRKEAGPLAGSFDIVREDAWKWAEQHAGELIVQPADITAIRHVITDAFKAGTVPRDVVKELKRHIGLYPKLAAAHRNYAAKVRLLPISKAEMEKLIVANYRRLIDYRAKMIARTEAAFATNAGQHILWQAAIDEGFLGKDESFRRWVITWDDRLCPRCLAMIDPATERGQSIPFDATFSSIPQARDFTIKNTGEGVSIPEAKAPELATRPPLHPHCRCTTVLDLRIAPAGRIPRAPRPVRIAPAADPLFAIRTIDSAALRKIGEQRGSQAGGMFLDETTGEQWYIKASKSAEHARNELLASRLYELTGVDAAHMELGVFDGRTGVASLVRSGLGSDRVALTTPGAIPGVYEGFAADAWLANWDVVGLNFDNLLLSERGAFRLDFGGALRFRAQGGTKGAFFSDAVGEFRSLMSTDVNAEAALVFRHADYATIKAAITRINAIPAQRILDLVGAIETDPVIARKLGARLLARRDSLLNALENAAETLPGEYIAGVAMPFPPITTNRYGALKERWKDVVAAWNAKTLSAADYEDILPWLQRYAPQGGTKARRGQVAFKEWKDEAQATKWANMPPRNAWAETLTVAEKRELDTYSGVGYAINGQLRRGRIVAEDRLRNLDNAIAKGSMPENRVLWRGIGHGAESFLGLPANADLPNFQDGLALLRTRIGATIEDAGFLSASMLPQIPDSFSRGRILIKIRYPKGGHAAFLAQDARSQMPGELEILLPRDLKFVISDVLPVPSERGAWQVVLDVVKED